ncbi:expressed protein [Cryptococcus deneoformans JEC21]|uniref:ATP synthase F(0) complex subunit e, mitochondrial n=1 Tax=Cryptococcus deneoformans (strain JEC21 / ATCC MYA-565) TaxID=214684 RepID=Q5KDU0_CRYD1|nr:expressed protein [Cryptococcus neoformans var. neoformans JEC21]AAW44635.1 expressed protein [Cryptococcus neoformans var. neoformans JEC21]
MHRRSNLNLARKHSTTQVKHHAAHRAHLVEEAKKAYAAKKAAQSGGSSLITDPEDPKFDLEKVIKSWTKDS